LTAAYTLSIIVTIMSNIPDVTAKAKAELLAASASFMSSAEAARKLGIRPEAASRLVKQGKLPGVKIGRSYVIPRESVDSFSIGYVPARGRPKAKRKYTKRSPKWFQ
jgi:excisionase family DNA binding protein